MVVRKRLHAVLIPLSLYIVSATVSGFFVWHAFNGERGLKAKEAYRRDMEKVVLEQRDLSEERERIERLVAAMRSDSVERDLLEEMARVELGRVHKNDVVVFLPKSAAAPAGSPATK